MRKVLLLFLLIACTVTEAQEVIGYYHSNYFNQDFEVRLDCLDKVYKEKKVHLADGVRHIYFQVQCDEPNVKAYIQMDPGDALGFVKDIKKNAVKLKKWVSKKSRLQEKTDDGELNDFYFVGEGGKYIQPTIGYESGLDYNVMFIRGKEGEPILQCKGDEANNEGDIKFKINGWNLILSNMDNEIAEIEKLINKAISRKEEIKAQRLQERKTAK